MTLSVLASFYNLHQATAAVANTRSELCARQHNTFHTVESHSETAQCTVVEVHYTVLHLLLYRYKPDFQVCICSILCIVLYSIVCIVLYV
jgi:hypothetical protein